MEAGRTGGQGPDSCNLAACHSCCLLPETPCEESNRFLDRAMVVGDFEQADLGFFFDWEDLASWKGLKRIGTSEAIVSSEVRLANA